MRAETKFALVGNRYHLIKMPIDGELSFDYLRSDVFAVARFEEVFDAFRDIEFAVFDVASISCAEPAIFEPDFLRATIMKRYRPDSQGS